MRKLWTCLFYGLCAFTVLFSLYWMALPRLPLPSSSGSEAPVPEADLAAQAVPDLTARRYLLCDKGGQVAVYLCDAEGKPETLLQLTGIYVNLLPESDVLRIKRGIPVYSRRELDLLLEDLGG